MTGNLNVLLKKSFVFTIMVVFTLSGINTGWSDTSVPASPTQILSIPYDLGKITDSFEPATGREAPLLIHIEDAHAHFETQSKIRDILNYLRTNYAINTVFIEGASSKLDTELFNIFPDQQMNVKAAERWMKEGQFSGAEVFGIQNGAAVTLRGVENADLYTKNLKEFRNTHKLFETQQPVLDEWNSRLKQIKEKVYLGDLKQWDEAEGQFSAGKIDILEYARVLKAISLKHNISLEKYPQIEKLFALENAARVSPEKWRQESAEIGNFITLRISKTDPAQKILSENWRFVSGNTPDKNSLLATDPRLFFEILITAGERYGFSFQSFTELPRIARYLIFQKEISGSEVMTELFNLEHETGLALVETRQERETYQIDEAFRHLSRLFHLAIERDEWNRICQNQNAWNPAALYPRIQHLEQELFKNPKTLQPLDGSILEHALRFYDLAYQREEALVQNSLDQMKTLSVPKAVLITGGFHSDGIRVKMESAHLNYLSIHPNVMAAGDESHYLEVMLGQRNILPDFYFNKSEKNSLATPAQLAQPGRLIVRTLLESGSVIPSSSDFRTKLGANLNRLVQRGAFNGVFAVNPVFAEVGSSANELEVFLKTSRETIRLIIPRDSTKAPNIETTESVTAKSLGSKAHKSGKGSPIDVSQIAMWGFRTDVMKTTAAVLAGREVGKSKRLRMDIYDIERNITSTELGNHEGDRQPIYDKAKADGYIVPYIIEEFTNPEEFKKNIEDWQNKVLREHQVVLIDPGVYPSDGDIEFYERYITERAQGFAKALYRLRQSGDMNPRIFAIRNQIRPKLTEEVMHMMLDAYKEESKRDSKSKGRSENDYDYDTGFTVVHVPDLFRGGRQMKDMEKQKIIFGFPDLKNVLTKDILKRRPFALEEFKTVEKKAETALKDIFVLPSQGKDNYLKLNARSAELAPFGNQLYLFTKLLTFMTFSQLVHALGGDMEKVAMGAGLDYRVGLHFTKIAFGIGGRARKFIESPMARISPMLKKWIQTLRHANNAQIKWFQKIIEDTLSTRFGIDDLANQEIAVLGIAYKSQNGSLMGSPSMDLIRWLVEKRVGKIYISDPYVDQQEFLREIAKMKEQEKDASKKEAIQRALSLNIFEFRKNPLQAIQESKAVIIATDHPEFKNLPAQDIATAAKGENGDEEIPIFDGRNLYSPVTMGKAGINYISIGRQPVGPKFGPTKDWDAIENVAFDKNRTGMKVAMIGGVGYVALTTGGVMADCGNDVTNLEVQVDKVEKLNQELKRAVDQNLTSGIDIGIHEPGLGEVIIRNFKAGRLRYVPSYDDKNLNKFVEGDPAAQALAEAEVVYLGVGTPEGHGGEADLRYILGATRGIGYVLKNIVSQHPGDPKYPNRKVIVVKSTVPPGAFEEMKRVLENEFGLKEEVDFDLASNPEFLREGQAVDDVFKPVRTVLGVKSEFAAKKLRELWYPLEKRWPHKVLITDVVTAPLIKYLSNVFLAISISFVNALAWYAQDEGASITQIVQAMKSDHRISTQAIKVLLTVLEIDSREQFITLLKEKKVVLNELEHLPQGWEDWPSDVKQYCLISAFLGPGIGWGGSCFPKDLKAAKYLYEQVLKKQFGIIDATIEINDLAPERVYQDIIKFLDKQLSGRMDVPLKGKKITVLGTAFKGDTDDVRETRTLPFILKLLEGGAQVTLHDPHPRAMLNFKRLLAETILFSKIESPLIAKIRTMPFVLNLKEKLQKEHRKLRDKEMKLLFRQVFGPNLVFVTNSEFTGDKNISKEQKEVESRKEIQVLMKASTDSDLVVIVTDWDIFKTIDLKRLYKKMTRKKDSSTSGFNKAPIIFDARNLLKNRDAVSARNFFLLQVGEKPLFPKNQKITDSPQEKTGNGHSHPKSSDGPETEGPSTAVAASSLGAVSDSARQLVDKWMRAQAIDNEHELVNTIFSAAENISPDARETALRIFSKASNELQGELIVPVEAESFETLRELLAPVALELRGDAKKHVTIAYSSTAVKTAVKTVLAELKVSPETFSRFVAFKNLRTPLETYLIGRTAKFGEGRVVLIGDSALLEQIQVSGVRKISRDRVRAVTATETVKDENRLVAQIAAIDLGLDLLASTVTNPHPDKLDQNGSMYLMKESFLNEFVGRWLAELHAQMALLISA